jgi:hypothetical protein
MTLSEELDTPNWTAISNYYLDNLAGTLSLAEQSMMMVIFRFTAGYHQKQAHITYDTFQRRTGLSRQGVQNAIDSLEKKIKWIKVIRPGYKKTNIYQLCLKAPPKMPEYEEELKECQPVNEELKECQLVNSVDQTDSNNVSKSTHFTSLVNSVDYSLVNSVDSLNNASKENNKQTGVPPDPPLSLFFKPLVELGLSAADANKLIALDAKGRLAELIEHVKIDTSIGNRFGWLKSAIEKNYQLPKPAEKKFATKLDALRDIATQLIKKGIGKPSVLDDIFVFGPYRLNIREPKHARAIIKGAIEEGLTIPAILNELFPC